MGTRRGPFGSARSPCPIPGCVPLAICCPGTPTPVTPRPSAGGDPPAERPRRNKESTRTSEDALEWALGQGIGECLSSTGSAGSAQPVELLVPALWLLAVNEGRHPHGPLLGQEYETGGWHLSAKARFPCTEGGCCCRCCCCTVVGFVPLQRAVALGRTSRAWRVAARRFRE